MPEQSSPLSAPEIAMLRAILDTFGTWAPPPQLIQRARAILDACERWLTPRADLERAFPAASVRTVNALMRTGYTVESVEEASDDDLLEIRNFGRVSLAEVRGRFEPSRSGPAIHLRGDGHRYAGNYRRFIRREACSHRDEDAEPWSVADEPTAVTCGLCRRVMARRQLAP